MISKWMAFLFLALLLAACSRPHQESQSNPTLIGYKLIDEGKADEAIDHFQVLLDEDPSSDDYRRGLSSAYALRAGFRVQTLVKPMKEIREADRIKSDVARVLRDVLGANANLKPVQNLLSFEIELIVFLKKFESVPSFNPDQVLDLRAAISSLRYLQNISSGDYLYMAVLESLILKHNLQKKMQASNCESMVLSTQERTQSVAMQYGKILGLLIKTQPSQAKNFERQMVDLEHLAAETSLLTTSSLMTLSLVKYATEADTQPRLFTAMPQCQL